MYWPKNVTICDCNGITLEKVRQAIKEQGPKLDQIKKVSRAALNCGICEQRIKSIIENTYDVIIVGAGLGGLTTGAKLSREGKKVLVLEKHDITIGLTACLKSYCGVSWLWR